MMVLKINPEKVQELLYKICRVIGAIDPPDPEVVTALGLAFTKAATVCLKPEDIDETFEYIRRKVKSPRN